MRRHEHTVRREHGRHLIIISGVERGYKILSKTADHRLHIQKRTRVRNGTRIGPVHLLPPGGRHRVKVHCQRMIHPLKLDNSSAKYRGGKGKVLLPADSWNQSKERERLTVYTSSTIRISLGA